MNLESLMDRIPVWMLFILTVVVVIAPVDVGYRIGRRRRLNPKHEESAAIEVVVASVLALLGFMLAFTFNLAQVRYDDRRLARFASVNAISTAYLRSEFAGEPQREIRRLLRAEVDLNLKVRDIRSVPALVAQLTAIHDTLWRVAAAVGQQAPASLPASLLVQSVNQVIDESDRRLYLLRSGRLPGALWATLYLLAVLGMGLMGYQVGVSGSRWSKAMLPFSLAFAIVMTLIIELDRPHARMIRLLDEESFVELQRTFDAAERAR